MSVELNIICAPISDVADTAAARPNSTERLIWGLFTAADHACLSPNSRYRARETQRKTAHMSAFNPPLTFLSYRHFSVSIAAEVGVPSMNI